MHLNHWLEQWYLSYKQVSELPIERESFALICYESLCDGPVVWKKIKKQIDVDQNIAFEFRQSKKIIDEDFDEGLLKRCNDLYEDLKVHRAYSQV